MIARIDIQGCNKTLMRAIYVSKGNVCPNHNIISENVIEFYDLRYMHTPDGQFITRYSVETYMEDYDSRHGLDLQTDVENWKIDNDARQLIGNWIKHLEQI